MYIFASTLGRGEELVYTSEVGLGDGAPKTEVFQNYGKAIIIRYPFILAAISVNVYLYNH